MMTLFTNGTQQGQTFDSTAMLRAASILFCQRELWLNETDEQQQFFDKFRPDQQTSVDATDTTDNTSFSYIYDNSTSKLMCVLVTYM